jgi:hypothetical protein
MKRNNRWQLGVLWCPTLSLLTRHVSRSASFVTTLLRVTLVSRIFLACWVQLWHYFKNRVSVRLVRHMFALMGKMWPTKTTQSRKLKPMLVTCDPTKGWSTWILRYVVTHSWRQETFVHNSGWNCLRKTTIENTVKFFSEGNGILQPAGKVRFTCDRSSPRT